MYQGQGRDPAQGPRADLEADPDPVRPDLDLDPGPGPDLAQGTRGQKHQSPESPYPLVKMKLRLSCEYKSFSFTLLFITCKVRQLSVCNVHKYLQNVYFSFIKFVDSISVWAGMSYF